MMNLKASSTILQKVEKGYTGSCNLSTINIADIIRGISMTPF
jgi:hypothetical protein